MKYAICCFSLFLSFLLFASDNNYSSVMSSGDWFKISVEHDGIYRITYSELVNLGIFDPENVRIYGLGGSMLPEMADENSSQDLREIPLWMHTNDGVFKSGDYILFYGQAPTVWQYNAENKTFEHFVHLWDTKTYYFITSKAGGKRISTETPPTTNITNTVTCFDERQFHEMEMTNLLRSGRHWYGENFFGDQNAVQRFNFTIPDIVYGESATINIAFMARANSSAAQLQVRHNHEVIATHSLPENLKDHDATATSFNTLPFYPVSGNVPIELSFIRNGVQNAGGWLDFIRLFVRRKLNMSTSQIFFRDTRTVGTNQTSSFQITGSSSNIHVWDISDVHNVKRMQTSLSGSTLSFSAHTDNLREFVAFDATSGLLRPNFPQNNGRTENQNLRGIENVDMIIVTHPNFLEASRDLAALHIQRDGLAVAVVTTQQIYNEFSSGMQDPAAIRNFSKFVYEKPSAVKLKYLLLMGAGSYDNRSVMISAATNPNFVVTYQSDDSLHGINSYVSDDYFGILDDNEHIETGKLSIGVGRIPVRTAQQARDVVEKTRRYMDAMITGDWQNVIGLLAEDGDSNNFTKHAEELAEYISDNHPQCRVEKLYLDAFPRIATVDGHRYPELETQLLSLFDNGSLLINYIGHGNTTGLTSGRVLNNTNILQLQNRLYPIFVAATCDFGRYDGVSVSGSENMMLSANGGSIAVVSSSRLVYSMENLDFNLNFIQELLTRFEANDNEQNRLGDILRRAKNATKTDSHNERMNKLCFALIGNPALKPLIPEMKIKTLTINDISACMILELDTLKANGFVTVKGAIIDKQNNIHSGFNGVLHFALFDKPHERKTFDHNNDGVIMNFTTQTSTLFKGKAAVTDGLFEVSFILPRNINHQYGFGKFTYFAISNDGKNAAAGSYREIIVGGSMQGTENEKGPQIYLFMNDTYFRSGGITDQNPRLLAFLQDEKGINTSDESIGHNITAVLNNDYSNAFVLNRYYEADLGYHNRGIVSYRFTNLPQGNYELTFTAWNLDNIPSQKNILFRVASSSTLKIDNLFNYPNPFTDNTRIYFEFNMPFAQMQIELQIYDITGRLLRSMKQSYTTEGYTSGDFEWDGRDSNGNRMYRGVYPYRVILSSDKGEMVLRSSRMTIW